MGDLTHTATHMVTIGTTRTICRIHFSLSEHICILKQVGGGGGASCTIFL